MMKQITFGAVPTDGAPGSGIYNLRPAKAVGGSCDLVPVGPPKMYTVLGGYRPLTRCSDRLLASKGERVMIFDEGSDRPGPVVIFSAEVLCAMDRGDGKALVMTAEGPAELDVSTNPPSVRKLDSEYPAVRLSAAASVQVSAVVQARTLSKTYSGTGRLSAADSAALVGDMADAYLDLCSQSSLSGVFIQPALARYKLRDRDGKVLFVSPAVLLTHPDGSQCDTPLELHSSDGATVASYTLSAKCWKLNIEIPAGLEDADVEIWMSPMFHPYNPALPPAVGMVRGGTTAFTTISLPGYFSGVSSHYVAAGRSTLLEAFARMDAIETRVAVLRGSGHYAPDCAPDPDAGAVAKALRKVLKVPAAAADPALRLLLPPHSFSASCVAVAPGACLWGGLRAIPFGGYPLGCFVSSTATGSATATVTVRFGDTKGVRRSETFATAVPAAIGPLLSYPSADATEISIVYSSAGVLRKGVYPLVPDPSGCFAVYVSPDFLPFVPPQVSAAAVTDLEDASTVMTSYVAAAKPGSPLDVTAVLSPGGGDVRGVSAMGGSHQSWEFGRSRFVVSTATAAFSLVLGSGFAASVRRIADGDVTPVMPSADSGVYMLVDGRPYFVGYNGRMKRIGDRSGYAMIAYDSRRGELWCIAGGGNADICIRDHGWRYFSTSIRGATGTAMVGDSPYFMSPDGLACLSEETGGEVEIEFAASARTPGCKPMTAKKVLFDVSGESVDLYLGLEALCPDGAAKRPLLVRHVVGDIRSAMPVAVFGLPADAFKVSLRGKVAASAFRIHDIHLILNSLCR